ncbi:MAG: hypothetical protein ACI4L6_02605 [Candidatus Onthoplasma sp.]
MEKRIGILDDNTIITMDNIEKLSKIIAISSLKHFKNYAYSNTSKIERLHKQLQYDIAHHKELDCYSDAYDLVQEASLFLLKFLDKRLGDYCTYIKPTVKQPQIITIRNACFKSLSAYIRKELKNGNTENEELLEFLPAKDQFEEQVDYSKANEIIRKIVTTKLEMQILEYYYNGVEPKYIAEFLDISSDKVYKRRKKFKDRYLAYCI